MACKHDDDPFSAYCIDCILEAREKNAAPTRPVEWSADHQRPIIRLTDEDGKDIVGGPYLIVDTARPRPENISLAEWDACVEIDNQEMKKPF